MSFQCTLHCNDATGAQKSILDMYNILTISSPQVFMNKHNITAHILHR